MKLEIEYWILVVLIFVAMGMAIIGSCKAAAPYHMNSNKLAQYPFEGYANGKEGHMEGHMQGNTEGEKEGLTGLSVKGFEGHFNRPSDNTGDIDKFSKASGSRNDSKKSFGLTNTMGHVVLDDEMVKMLTTRGGNITGRPDTM